jgi:hypothetical protein
MTVGANDRCPCGSGKKYKRCCQQKHEAARGAAARERLYVPPGGRVVERNGQRMVVIGGIADRDLDVAANHFDRKDRGSGFAQSIAEFSQPLIDAAADAGPDALQNALSLGGIFWNLAVTKDKALREEMLEDMLNHLGKTGPERDEFRAMAAHFVERHRAMFPQMHT